MRRLRVGDRDMLRGGIVIECVEVDEGGRTGRWVEVGVAARPVRKPRPRVSDPIIFRAQKDGPEHEVRPCSDYHRALWLSGWIILSCTPCNKRLRKHEPEAESEATGP